MNTEYEYGTAIRDKDGTVWDFWPNDSMYPVGTLRNEYMDLLNSRHRRDMGDDWDGSEVVVVRRQKVTDWEVV